MKGTNKLRKRLFYNLVTETLFIETKINSGQFIDEKNVTIDINTINEWNRYIDLSLFPAHIFKSYGKIVFQLKENDIVWVHDRTNKRKPFLAIITKVERNILQPMSPDTYQFKKIELDGTVSNKTIFSYYDKYHFAKSLENYKIETKIKLI